MSAIPIISAILCFPIFTERWCHSINCLPVCPSVTFRYRDHICWNTSKIISPPNSDKIVMWRFLHNRLLLLCLHTIFRALIYWAHCVVILVIAWHLVSLLIFRLTERDSNSMRLALARCAPAQPSRLPSLAGCCYAMGPELTHGLTGLFELRNKS